MLTDRLFLAVSAGKLVSVVGLMLMPVQVGAMLDGLQLGEGAVGFLATMEFSALGVGILFVAMNPLKTSALKYALIGAALIVAGQVASALVATYGVLAALRFIVGFGAGLANAAATVTIAAHFNEPERTAGYAFGLVYVVGGALYLASPYMTGFGYHRGVFLSVAVVVLVFTPLLFALPDTPLQKKKRPAARRDAILTTAALLLFTAEVFLMVGMGAAWAFGERMGLAVNLTPKEIGFYFACTMIASIIGSLFAGWLGTRFGRTTAFRRLYHTGLRLLLFYGQSRHSHCLRDLFTEFPGVPGGIHTIFNRDRRGPGKQRASGRGRGGGGNLQFRRRGRGRWDGCGTVRPAGPGLAGSIGRHRCGASPPDRLPAAGPGKQRRTPTARRINRGRI